MREDTPTVYLLVGPSGPGKAAYSQALAERGVVRLQADTELTEETAATLVGHVESGRDVMVEYESADQPERDRCQHLADQSHAECMVVNFTLDHNALAARLA